MKEMCNLLDAFETEIFERWKRHVPNDINMNMKKFLLISNDNGLLELNFDKMLVLALKETKLLKAMGKDKIPDVALELFENSNELWVRKLIFVEILFKAIYIFFPRYKCLLRMLA